MAALNITDHNVVEQLETTARQLHAKREDLLRHYAIFCHRVSALPVLTGSLANQVEEGESYETLARGIGQVHRNISEVAAHAEQLCNLFGCCD